MLKLVHSDDDSIWVKKEEFCSHYRIPTRTVTRYIAEGQITSYRTNERGNHILHLLHAYNEFRTHQKPTAANDPTKAETSKLKNELLKLELDQRREKLISRETVEQVETYYLSKFKAMLRQMPARMASVSGHDEKNFERIVDETINSFTASLDAKKKMYEELLKTSHTMKPF
jgi:acyl-CoA synthetase (NDP forming)